MVRQTRNMRRNGNDQPSGDSTSGAERVGESDGVNGADNRGVNVGVGVDVAAAIQAALAPVMATIGQLLERLPVVAPPPVVQPVGAGVGVEHAGAHGEMPGVGVNQAGARVEMPGDGVEHAGGHAEPRVPSYLKVMEHMQRLGTRYFSGGSRPAEAEEWRSRLEKNFDSVRCPEEYKADFGIHFLEGEAHLWWDSVVRRRGRTVRTWEEFREEFNEKYFPQEALDSLESQFLDLRQGSKSVREYESEFNGLKRYAGRDLENERVQIKRFMRGMRLELRNRCLMRDYRSMGDLVEKAAVIEAGMIAEDNKRQAKVADHRKSQSGSANAKSGKFVSGQKRKWDVVASGKPSSGSGSGVSGRGCYRCGSEDHRIANCPKPEVERTCHYCKEPGHFRNQCPKLTEKPDQGPAMALPPPPKRPAGVRQVYTMAEDDTGGASTSRPITGKFRENFSL